MPKPCNKPTPRLPVIGLLGVPGSGKSTVARRFAAEGCAVIDADQLAREAFDDDAIRQTLVGWWGAGVVTEGAVDRKQVASIVFNDPDQRHRLEGLVHPYVNRRRDEMRAKLQSANDDGVVAIIEDCPLLLEIGLEDDCDVLIWVDCPLEERRERVRASRGWSAQQLQAREDAQWPLDTKRSKADYTIINVGEAEAIQARVRDVLQDILKADARACASRAPRM